MLETAVLGKKSPAILARLAKQVSIYYDDCSRMLSNPPLNQASRSGTVQCAWPGPLLTWIWTLASFVAMKLGYAVRRPAVSC